MYTSLEQIINEITTQYSNVTELGLLLFGGTYSHKQSRNGIGCAIGCLLSEKVAEQLEQVCAEEEAYGIQELYENGGRFTTNDVFLRDYVFSQFDFTDYTIHDLAAIQKIHDSAASVSEFLDTLNKWFIERTNSAKI